MPMYAACAYGGLLEVEGEARTLAAKADTKAAAIEIFISTQPIGIKRYLGHFFAYLYEVWSRFLRS
jgi:hypothetical protein